MSKLSGIYCIENIIDNKKYIGQSADLNKREKYHFWVLEKNKHYNNHLQRAYNKYNKNFFVFRILIYCESFELTKYEQFFVNFYGYKTLYNICLECVDSTFGTIQSEESRKLMSLHHPDVSGKNNPNFGKDFTGENNPRTKLTWEKVNWIRKHRKEYTIKQLAKMFDISDSAMKYLCLGKTWKEGGYHPVPIKRNQTGENNPRVKLTWKNVNWIREHRKEYTIKQLAKMFNVSKSSISNICLNISWKNKEN